MAGSTLGSATELRVAGPVVAAPVPGRVEQPWRGFVRRFGRNRIGMVGAAIVLVCVLVAVLAPVLAPYPPEETHPNWRLYPPNEYFLFGTDEFGRDILSRIMYGAQVSLEVGLISVTLAL